MSSAYVENIRERISKTLSCGQIVGIVGWRPSYHNEVTRELERTGKIRFFDKSPQQLPKTVGFALTTIAISHGETMRLRRKSNVLHQQAFKHPEVRKMLVDMKSVFVAGMPVAAPQNAKANEIAASLGKIGEAENETVLRALDGSVRAVERLPQGLRLRFQLARSVTQAVPDDSEVTTVPYELPQDEPADAVPSEAERPSSDVPPRNTHEVVQTDSERLDAFIAEESNLQEWVRTLRREIETLHAELRSAEQKLALIEQAKLIRESLAIFVAKI